VNALERNDIQLAQQMDPGEKLAQALELMAVGFRLKRAVLRDRRPGASEAEIQSEFEQWLIADG
jgi:hypothetical protein